MTSFFIALKEIDRLCSIRRGNATWRKSIFVFRNSNSTAAVAMWWPFYFVNYPFHVRSLMDKSSDFVLMSVFRGEEINLLTTEKTERVWLYGMVGRLWLVNKWQIIIPDQQIRLLEICILLGWLYKGKMRKFLLSLYTSLRVIRKWGLRYICQFLPVCLMFMVK